MKNKLKKGQAFIGIDDNKYYFLGYDYDGQIMFTDLYLWTDKNQKYVVKNNLFNIVFFLNLCYNIKTKKGGY